MALNQGKAVARSAVQTMLNEHQDVVRESVAFMVRELIEAEVSRLIGAELGERSNQRSTHRNGYRHRRWDTRAGTIDVAVPKLRQGSYLPSILEPRKRHEQALVSVVQEAYVNGVSTQQPVVAAAVRQVFAAQIGTEARERLGEVVARLEGPASKVARLLQGAEEDLLGFYEFSREHWSKLRSTNPLERLNREIGRRSDVVGIYPNDAALIRLAGMVLLEQHEEWSVGRRYLSETSMRLVLNCAATAPRHRVGAAGGLNFPDTLVVAGTLALWAHAPATTTPDPRPGTTRRPTRPRYTTKRDLTHRTRDR